jgi:hypothetical protein
VPTEASAAPESVQAAPGIAGAASAGSTGNHALRRLRLRRFWTQADFAAAFEARSRQIGRPLSLSVRQVRRWESDNPPLPLPAYQAVLEALFAVPIERMGFQPLWAGEQEGPTVAGERADRERDARSGPAFWGAGVTRSPHDDHERHDPVKRRQFMAGAVAIGSGGLAATPAEAAHAAQSPVRPPDELPAFPERTPQQAEAAAGLAERIGGQVSVDPALVSGYSVITAQQRSLYWAVAAGAMFAPVSAHAELGLGLLRAARSPELRTRLARPVAETALLAARLAFFDLRQPRLADGYLAMALDAAQESADRALAAAVLAHMAFVPAFAGQARRARELITRARAQGQGVIGALQSSWMYAVESEIEARVGGRLLANDLIARSEGELGSVRVPSGGSGDGGGCGDRGTPEWLDFFDASRLAGFKGYCRLATGRGGEAAVSLEFMLRNLPTSAAKQRSITLADLAHARAQQGEFEESARLLGGAIAQLRRSWYATGVERVDTVRRRLAAVKAPLRVLTQVEEARHSLEERRP